MWRRLRRSLWRMVRRLALIVLGHTGVFDTTARRLRRLKRLGFEVQWAVDGGASVGTWVEEFKRVFPRAEVICIEPRESAQGELRATAARIPGIHIVQALMGDSEGEVEFFEHADQSSILHNAKGRPFGEVRKLPMTTLDRIIAERGFPLPDLIKLDLQGAELVCLRGAERCLTHVQAVLLEVSFLPLYRDIPLFAEVLRFMDERGFQCFDILALWHRPLDDALAFGDVLFLRKGHPFLTEGRWSARAGWE